MTKLTLEQQADIYHKTSLEIINKHIEKTGIKIIEKQIYFYVFIDDHNGHGCTYHNFKSEANEKEIKEVMEFMDINNPYYRRLGMSVDDLINSLQLKGFASEIETNNIYRCPIDRIKINCISGNY